jgi:hypothetical protein
MSIEFDGEISSREAAMKSAEKPQMDLTSGLRKRRKGACAGFAASGCVSWWEAADFLTWGQGNGDGGLRGSGRWADPRD